MIADDLSPEIWNAIAREIGRQAVTRELVFSIVTKRDEVQLLIWASDFGDMSIPLVTFLTRFNYYDTVQDGSVRRRDKLPTQIVVPAIGDLAVILDIGGTKTYPICIGVVASTSGYWEED
jgi:hypothetical protein